MSGARPPRHRGYSSRTNATTKRCIPAKISTFQLFLVECDVCHTDYGKAVIVYGSSGRMAALELVVVQAPGLCLATSSLA